MKKTKCGFHKISVLCFVVFFAVAVVFSSVTFSRFYSEVASENGAQVATAVAHYGRERLSLVSDGVETPIIIENDSKQIEIGDIQPEDEIKFYFSVSDTDGTLHNEVYLRVTIAFTVRLEMIGEEKRKRTGFSAGKDYSGEDYSSSSTEWGADLKFQRDIETGGVDVPHGSSLEGTDYNGNELYIKEEMVSASDDAEAYTSYVHTAGFYLPPYSGSVQEKNYCLSFRLPGQADVVDAYAGARLYIDFDITAEQINESQTQTINE